jgi:DNA-binding SARP family transcriptional activator
LTCRSFWYIKSRLIDAGNNYISTTTRDDNRLHCGEFIIPGKEFRVMQANMKNNGRIPLAASAENRFKVRTFGGLTVYCNDVPVTIVWESRKARLLFCCLLVTYDQWIHRQRVIEALWPECTLDSGEKNFKTTLSRLRKSFSAFGCMTPVITQAEAVRLNYLSLGLDASEFRNNATQGIKRLVRGDTKSARKLLETAQDLYYGSFLPEEPHNKFIADARCELAAIHTSVIKALEKSYLLDGNSDALEVFSFLKNPSLGEHI